MKHPDLIEDTLARIAEQTAPPPRLSPRMIWLRGLALERQRAARRSLLVTRLLTALVFVAVIVAGSVFASISAVTTVSDHLVGATCVIIIIAYTALQLVRTDAR